MKGFRTRISRKDSSTPPPGSPSAAKKSSPLAPAPARSGSGDSFRLPRGSADSTSTGTGTGAGRPQRTASRSSTGSTSSLSAAVRRAGSSSRVDALSSTRDPGPLQQARAPPPAADQPPLKEEPTDPVLPPATPKDTATKDSTPEPTIAVKPESPPTPPRSPPPPEGATPPIPRSMSPPLTIETNGVPRRGSGSEAEQVKPDEESFELLGASETQAPAEPPSMQMPQPDTSERAADRFLATNPFLDQPETPIDGPRLVAPMPTRANGKSVSFSQTVQEISPLTDYAPSALPSPAEDVKSDRSSSSSSATGLNANANSSGFNWVEHVLPDTTYYYTLPAHLSPTQTGVVTDMDLRTPARLRVVEAYLRTIPPVAQQPLSPSSSQPAPPMPEPDAASKMSWRDLVSPTHMPMPAAQYKKETVEVYLRNVATRARQGQGEFVPLTTYVRHGARAVSMAPPYETREGLTDADRLDQEAQYWSFVEAHPAHAPLPDGARDEALEALTWSYTERVIQSRTAARVGNAFSERECHELLALLRGLDGPKSSSAIHTRIVAKVHLRLAQWRQQFVALGDSGGYPPSPSGQQQQQQKATFDIIEPRVRVPFRRSCARLVFGVLCLGIPYLFFARQTRSGSAEDEEADAPAARTRSLVLSAAVCLVGAVMLSVSVTFLALPGLENVARALALVSVCCSLASLGASVLVVPRRPGSAVTFTRARALPVVLLAYAVASFVGATVAYAAKGVVARDPRIALERFGAQTLWLVLGVWAVLALVLGGAAWALRERRPAQARGGYRALPS